MTKPIKTIIVDDERGAREVLKLKLTNAFPELQICGEAESIEFAYKICYENKPNLVFLDVKLQDGNGFDLIKKFEAIDFEIILATGYHDFALDAIKVEAVDYIIKPYKTAELIDAVKKAVNRIAYKEFLKNNQHSESLESTDLKDQIPFQINTTQGIKFINPTELIRCQGWEKYTYFFLNNGEKYLTVYNIGKYAEKLESLGFFHCHKSHIVNKSMIKGYNEGHIILKDNTEVPLARRRKAAFNEQMKIH